MVNAFRLQFLFRTWSELTAVLKDEACVPSGDIGIEQRALWSAWIVGVAHTLFKLLRDSCSVDFVFWWRMINLHNFGVFTFSSSTAGLSLRSTPYSNPSSTVLMYSFRKFSWFFFSLAKVLDVYVTYWAKVSFMKALCFLCILRKLSGYDSILRFKLYNWR